MPANADGTLKQSAGDASGQLDRLQSSLNAAFRCCPEEEYSEQEFPFFVEYRDDEGGTLHLYSGESWETRRTLIPEDLPWATDARSVEFPVLRTRLRHLSALNAVRQPTLTVSKGYFRRRDWENRAGSSAILVLSLSLARLALQRLCSAPLCLSRMDSGHRG